MSPTDIAYEVADGVAVATLDRPEKLNAVRQQTLAELLRILARAEADDGVRALVVTGRGRAFSAGQDLDELGAQLGVGGGGGRGDDGEAWEGRAPLDRYQEVTRRLLAFPKVAVAALNGVAVGFGAELSLACDVRIAAPEARIGFVEVTRALFETNGVTWLLPRLVGHGRAADLMLTGELVDGAEAHRIGLVTRLVPAAELVDAALGLGRRIAANAPISLRLVKEALRTTWERDLASAMEQEVQGMLACLRSEDLAEGTAAYFEKRAPRYRGR